MPAVIAVFGIGLPWWAAVPLAVVVVCAVVFSLVRDRSEPPSNGPAIREREFF